VNARRTLAVVGTWGAALTVLILANSVLLRLGTVIQAESAVSILPAGVEQGSRIAHRLAAMGVGILAALAFVVAWRSEATPRPSARPVAAVVGLTLLLAVVGRYSPGYRIDFVTSVNVAGGVALAAAFWALRRPEPSLDPAALAALAALVVLAALGAATDAAAMRGERAFGPLHMWVGMVFGILTLSAAWRGRARPWLAGAVVALTAAQVGLGLAILAVGARPIGLGWLHAMVACVLALVLVSLAFPTPPRREASLPS